MNSGLKVTKAQPGKTAPRFEGHMRTFFVLGYLAGQGVREQPKHKHQPLKWNPAGTFAPGTSLVTILISVRPPKSPLPPSQLACFLRGSQYHVVVPPTSVDAWLINRHAISCGLQIGHTQVKGPTNHHFPFRTSPRRKKSGARVEVRSIHFWSAWAHKSNRTFLHIVQ